MIVILLGWFFFSLIVGAIGSGKKIGFWGAFLIALLLSPVIGFVVAILSSARTYGHLSTKYYLDAEKIQKQGELKDAIALIDKSININSTYPPSHYKLAVLRSLQNDITALHSLKKAVELGYSDFDKIESDPDLEWLRNQPQFEIFQRNGYNKETSSIDFNEQLKELGELRDKNIITSQEFELQKGKILGTNI